MNSRTIDPDLLAEWLLTFSSEVISQLKNVEKFEDAASVRRIHKWTFVVLQDVLPDFIFIDSHNADMRRRFKTLQSLKNRIFLFMPQPVVEFLQQGLLIRKIYNFIAYHFTKVSAYYHTENDTVPLVFERFLAADSEKLRAASRSYLAQHPELASRTAADCFKLQTEVDAVFLSKLFPTTWLGIIGSLDKSGLRMGWMGDEEGPIPCRGYSNTSVKNLTIPCFSRDFLSILSLLFAARETTFLVNIESYFHAQWDIDRTAAMYLFNAALFRAAKSVRGEGAGKLCALMYDGIKPVIHVDGRGDAAEFYYKNMATSADLMVYNSNTPDFHDFIVNATNKAIPAAFAYRIQTITPEQASAPVHRLPYRPGEELHIACISVALSEFHEPSRDAVTEFLRKLIVSRGVVFHYYCDTASPGLKKFKKEATMEELEHIVFHPVIRDQSQLIQELQSYHLGFTPFDHNAFAIGIAGLKNRFYKDALSAFWQSTIATSFHVYSAAGLPIVAPRGCSGIERFVPSECILKASLSEIPYLAERIYAMDYQRIMDAASANRQAYTHPHLEDFLEKIK